MSDPYTSKATTAKAVSHRTGKAAVYGACSIKNGRRTKAAMEAIKTSIKAILADDHPMTVRQIFYQLVTRGVIEKTEEQYQGTVIRLLTSMRLSGVISFGLVIDETRRARQTRTFDSVSDAITDTAKFYRRSALRDCDDYLEIWSEKEALAGLIWDVASDYDVPVLVSKGMPSLTQLFGTAVNAKRAALAGKETFLYQFGDHDPSGVIIPKVIERRLVELCEKFDCPAPSVERIALTTQQIAKFNLPSRPTKRAGNTHARKFAGRSTELDALPADQLRKLVRGCIERHIPEGQLEALRTAEESEREVLEQWAKKINRAGARS